MKVLIALSVLSLHPGLRGAGTRTPGQLRGHRYEVPQLPFAGRGVQRRLQHQQSRLGGRAAPTCPDNQIRHATLWRNGVLTDLGTLGSPERNSVVRWPVKNVRGLITGISQTDEPDPLNENWSCSAFFPAATSTGYHVPRLQVGERRDDAAAHAWRHPRLRRRLQQRGQIVGWAENTVHDPKCEPPQVLQFRPVVWGPDDRIHELPLLPGDSSGAATAINDRGQIVGITGICDQAIGRFTASHAVLWDDGKVIDIGNLGGVAWHTPNAINHTATSSASPTSRQADGGIPPPHAFLWTERTASPTSARCRRHSTTTATRGGSTSGAGGGQVLATSTATATPSCGRTAR